MDEKAIFEVYVVRKRTGREHKHRILSFLVLASTPETAKERAAGWTDLPVVQVSAITAGVAFWGEINHLTDAELTLVEAEGYEALRTKRRADLDAEIAAAEAALADQEARS